MIERKKIVDKNEVVRPESIIPGEFEVTARRHKDQGEELKTTSEEFYIIENLQTKKKKTKEK